MENRKPNNIIQLLQNSLSPIAGYMNDPQVQEIMINAPDNVWIEQDGRVFKTEIRISEVEIRSAITLLAKMSGKDAKEGTRDSIIDARMEGFRIAAALAPVSVYGHSICIRKHGIKKLSLEDYLNAGGIDQATYDFLLQIVLKRKTVIIAGGTSSGKTTFLNAMINKIPSHEVIRTIEDTHELSISSPNWVAFEANPRAGITIRDLVKLCLRYRPDRIILGEVRGGEAFDLMQAVNTGHDGSFATLHANSAKAALARLETLTMTADIGWPLEAIRTEIGASFDYVVFLSRMAEGDRFVRGIKEIVEVNGYDQIAKEYRLKTIYERECSHA